MTEALLHGYANPVSSYDYQTIALWMHDDHSKKFE